ncbi:MAG: septum site-determining protein MinD [Acutalibacter sp.]|nr:septum site-determining protein MinD [Acutalibacter sp.]
MKRYVICDKRADFLHDVKMRALLDECECLITEISDGAKYRDLEDTFSGQIVVICENMLDELPEGFESGLSASQVMGYCLTRDGQGQFAARNIANLGMISSSSQILSMLLGMPGERADHLSPVPIPESGGNRETKPVGEDFSSWRQSIHRPAGPTSQPVKENREKDRVSSILELRESRVRQETDLLLKKEQERTLEKKAVTVTVTSTKGGVGKTTVATQLACCMALTSHGRGRFQTCIVDFDIGFGDVCTALDYNMRGKTIEAWVQDVRKRLSCGENGDLISYTEKEIQDFLQKKEDTGLYALLAPQSHAASLDITSEELQIIMRNLRENAGMDFVIYDTGNDLKDTTLLALEQAEYALLVVTQDISCAHCLDMLIRTLESIKFDSSKIRLVINDIMSAKATGISVSELEESFSYPCWAKIKHDPSIIRCNNFGKPVVFSASHDMTKQMRNVIRYLNETGEKLLAEEPRKGLWKRMFSGKEES